MVAGQGWADLARLREELVRAAAEEHRQHQRAAWEQRSAAQWQRRAALARSRKLPELALAAEQRASTHGARAVQFEVACRKQQTWVEDLRQALRFAGGPPTRRARGAAVHTSQARPNSDSLERRIGKLEREARIEQDLAELKRRRGVGRPGAAQPHARDGTSVPRRVKWD